MGVMLTDSAPKTGLPFSTEKLTKGLEAGIRRWRPGATRPLMGPICDVTSSAIERCLRERNVPAQVSATYEDLPEPCTWRLMHALTVAELADGPVTIDAVPGQFLPKVLGQQGVDKVLAERVRQAGMLCVAFPSGAYQEAIHEMMTTIFGGEADNTLLERAQAVYGPLWSPENLRPYTPNEDTTWIVDRILPSMQDALALQK